MIPDSVVGKRWLASSIVFGKLYVFEATSPTISRYVDSNGDGVPDQLDPITPAAVNIDTEFGFRGFSKRGTKVRADIGHFRHYRWHEVAESTSGLELIRRATNSARLGPTAVVGRIFANQKFIRCSAERRSTIQIFSGPDIDNLEPISGSYKTRGLRSHVDIPISSITTGHIVRLSAKKDSEQPELADYIVEPPRFWVFPWEPYFAKSGKKVIFRGSGFDKTMEVRKELPSGAIEDMNCIVLNSSEVLVVMPVVATRTWLKIYFVNPGGAQQVRKLPLRP